MITVILTCGHACFIEAEPEDAEDHFCVLCRSSFSIDRPVDKEDADEYVRTNQLVTAADVILSVWRREAQENDNERSGDLNARPKPRRKRRSTGSGTTEQPGESSGTVDHGLQFENHDGRS